MSINEPALLPWLNLSLLINLVLLLTLAIVTRRRKHKKRAPRIPLQRGLQSQHQNLAQRELKLAEMIALGYSNDLIAEELFISTEGVKKSKYRLKQKLGLSKSDDLRQYLLSIVHKKSTA